MPIEINSIFDRILKGQDNILSSTEINVKTNRSNSHVENEKWV